METIRTRLKKAADMAGELSLKESEVIAISVNAWDPAIAEFHIEPKTLIRSFHELKISRSSIAAREGEHMVIIHFVHRRFRFVSSLRKPDAATFMAINGQQRIEAKRPSLRRLSKRPQLPQD